MFHSLLPQDVSVAFLGVVKSCLPAFGVPLHVNGKWGVVVSPGLFNASQVLGWSRIALPQGLWKALSFEISVLVRFCSACACLCSMAC